MVILHDDIQTLYGAALPPVDIIVGSPPCQDLSNANPRAVGIAGARSGLFFEAVRLVGECRPIWGCFENSPTARIRGIDRVLAELEGLGYACWPLVVGAENVGAPHQRKRLWLTFADVAEPDTTRFHTYGPGRTPGSPGEMQEDCKKRERFRADAGQLDRDQRLAADGHALGEGLALGQEQSARQECAAAQRAGRSAWPDWQAGIPDLAQLDDGAATELAGNGALYRAICAAQGDAIVPQVALPILRTMHRLIPTRGRVLDLFSGAVGGWAYACRWAGLSIVASCESDAWRRAVYAKVHTV